MRNAFKTAALLAALSALLLFIGQLLGGQTGMTVALVAAIAMNFGSYWFADKIVLRMYNAREVGRSTNFTASRRNLRRAQQCRCRECT